MKPNQSHEVAIPLRRFPQQQRQALPLRLFWLEDIDQTEVDRHAFYTVMWLTAGAGTHYIDFNGYPIRQNTIYCMAPGQVHLWDIQEAIIGQAVIFTEDALWVNAANSFFVEELTLFNVINQEPSLYLASSQAAQLHPILDLLWQEQERREFGYAATLQSLLQAFLIYLQRYANAAHPERSRFASDRLTDRFRQRLENLFLTHQTVQAYADLLGVTANHLSESTKAATGVPAGALIRQRLILEAKRLLVHTNQPVQQIAEFLSFPDPSYFGRFFKREAGQSPIAFRNAIREKYHLSQH
jgi:AraC family transcriptional regulator, transcriptional activator of pobA